GAVIGENPLTLENGRAAVYVKAALGQTGTVTVQAGADGLAGASATVAVNPMTKPIVPASGAYAFGFVNDINDADRPFTYTGTAWQHGGGGAGGLFSGDNSWSDRAGDSASLAFQGNRVVLYGVLDPKHGTASVSIDGGPASTVSMKGNRRGNVP